MQKKAEKFRNWCQISFVQFIVSIVSLILMVQATRKAARLRGAVIRPPPTAAPLAAVWDSDDEDSRVGRVSMKIQMKIGSFREAMIVSCEISRTLFRNALRFEIFQPVLYTTYSSTL